MLKNILYSLLLVFTFSSTTNAQNYEEQYLKCSEVLPEINETIDPSYFEHLKKRDSCLVGAFAPNFSAVAIDGKKIELSELKGKVVVLNFWFTRCEGCIKKMPALNELVDFYSSDDVAFISFAPENKTTIEAFLQKHPFTFTAVSDSEYIRRDTFKLFSIWPYSIIIDREGKISNIWFGNAGEDVFEFYKEAIDKLL